MFFGCAWKAWQDNLEIETVNQITLDINLPRIFVRYNLKKYATHLFTTPLSNVIFDNMMSRLILTLTKQFFDNQFTHFKIKT